MAKNFPFFKFVATEWLTGDIVYEDFSTQGLFINICALYWQRDGKLSIENLNKRYKTEIINNLIDRFLTVKDGFISIKFLDEQLIYAGHISKVNSENGKKGPRHRRQGHRQHPHVGRRAQATGSGVGGVGLRVSLIRSDPGTAGAPPYVAR